ncbi:MULTISPECIES: DNA translocase FtsK [Rhizobium]|uniref:DNA translocase FtsK n=1 Tax=Rhizobium TaxID=379 RepID=UPI001B337326|nr:MULTISPECIES: DNA translocase FtsK [Rhizobium]MBX4910758.1 DNA translocase FtsK [Rhizobium bangladeshense]MBX5218326.1 DNA translocase FtsK [Rhizobium sp. NLR9a]MBX5236050.1 DNA translocase FtsK [Rhizobium sp. NLR4a]MBX5248363.1 DNA translocase FtsK [Rhizobium sp. NLR3b]MBX5253503.1 DNA translocase FtsK [Rhizobium sp. NLR4b]
MRFPRTNLTDAADFSSGIETELPEENPGERPPAPIWQSNFSLAPNVRFTRTPETLISRRRPSNDPVRSEPEAEQQAIRIEPVTLEVPFDIYLPEPAEAAAAPAQATETPQPPAAALEAPTLRVASELSSISDFAFWEVMAFEEGEPVRAPSIILPKIETAPESITSLFRIMEWRPGAPKPTQAASRPVQPPAAAPAPIAPRPPAAISLERPVRTREAATAPAPQAAPQTAPMPQVTPVPQAAPESQAALVPQAAPVSRPTPPVAAVLPSPRLAARPEKIDASGYEFPPRALLQEPPERLGEIMSQETLEQNAGLLESVLEDFGIKGEIIHVRPGPVVTLYEFEPAPGVKSSRVIGLADDIARSMSALSARVAVVPGRNVIGIELPNVTRETVYFREMIESQDFDKSGYKLALGLGKTIGGEPVIAELAKMPHLLVAGTTGSGKSVAINTMILSLLYRMTPEQCRLIMVDPKMLELSVYDGIPHLLTPVVTDPKKAVMALKWAVREMEERYRKMSRLGVRNIDGYNGRVSQAREKGETIHIMVQVGFDRQTGAPIEESQELDLAPMPYIVVIVDEMADLMMVAGKEIEGAIQRLAQMARAAGIHLIMATQRPSVDVITGTIKANFPTRISFQVTSKIDSRTILGEQGAEQLLGQGDMLHMQGGGRIARVHGPFVSDAEVEKVVAHLKTQGRPEYLDTVTADEEEEPEEEDAGAVFDKSAMASEDGNELYEQAVKVVMRDKKCSTSYIQRRLGIGYNRAASLVERMEKEGLVGPANHVGKREIVSGRSEGD